jgi:phage-related protein
MRLAFGGLGIRDILLVGAYVARQDVVREMLDTWKFVAGNIIYCDATLCIYGECDVLECSNTITLQ